MNAARPVRWIACGWFFLAGLLADVAEGQEAQPPRTSALYVMNADGTDLRPLVEVPGFEALGSPAWSPDGQYVAFDAYQSASGDSWSDCHIFIAAEDGSSLVDLGRSAMPSWSADGRNIACSRCAPNQGVWILAVDGSGERLIDSRGWGAQWSPDGATIAYTSGLDFVLWNVADGTSRSVAVPAEGNRQYVLWNFAWSPDGRQICFHAQRTDRSRELMIVTLDDDPQFRTYLATTSMQSDFAWHPGGRRIVFPMRNPERQRLQLFEFDPGSDDAPRLLHGQDLERANLGACWSPDGEQLVIVSYNR